MTDPRPRPRAFRLDDAAVTVDAHAAEEAAKAEILSQTAPIPDKSRPEPLDEGEREIEAAQAVGVARRWRPTLTTLVWTGLGGLVSLGNRLVGRRSRRGAVGEGARARLARPRLRGGAARRRRSALPRASSVALLRQRRIAELHADLARAHAEDDRPLARLAVTRLMALYEARPETAHARAEVGRASGEIIDGRDLVEIAERALVKPLDALARAEVAAAAKRVSLVTALSPRAVLDVIFVAAQVIRLTRRIAEIYGGRPGLLGFVKLARSISAHLVVTGGMAVGDTVLQGLVGHGIAAKLSARMGEGMLNGILTARVGLSALAVCRPAPFHAVKPPGVNDVAPFLFGKS